MALKNIDSYERAAIQSVARTGCIQYANLRDALEGKRAFGAQVRLLIELARRGHVNLTELVARDRKAQP